MKITIITAIILIIIFTYSCNYDYYEPVEFSMDDTISFTAQLIPIFNNNCNMSGCHITGSVSPDLSPDKAYRSLTLMGFVDTSDAESSILFARMDATSSPMPPEGRLSDKEVNEILYWIKQGALEN